MGAKKQQPEKAQVPLNEREPSSVRAGGYVRVSQERNFRNGYGLDAQVTDVKRYVEYRRWQLIELYREEGLSGYLPALSLKSSENGNKGNRPALDRLLTDARAGKFDVVVFPSIDRAARSVWNMIEIDEAFREMNVAVVFVREGIDTSDAMGQFFRNICASIAQFEGNLVHERLTKGKEAKAAQGGYCGGFAPYGYKAESGKFVVVPEEAEAVRQIFRWRIEGLSFRQIGDELSKRGIRSQRDTQWHPSTVRRILCRAMYTGLLKHGGKCYPGAHEAIVSVETFNQVQQASRDAAARLTHKRLREEMRQKAARGGYCSHVAPYGYRLKYGELVVVPEEAEVVRQVFQWRIQGRQFKQIRDKLRKRDVKTRRGGQWQQSTVRLIVNRPLYAGFHEHDGEYHPAIHEPIVSVETFNQAQQVFRGPGDRRLNASKRIRLPATPERDARQDAPSREDNGRET